MLEVQAVRDLLKQGKKHTEIAALLGVSKDRVSRFCSVHNLLSRRPPPPAVDLDALRRLIEAEKMPQAKAAELLGVSQSTVERWCKKLRLETQQVGSRPGEQHQFWSGGRRLVGRYWYVYAPLHPFATKHKVVAEHRLVMEKKLRRYLDPSEVVHHKDGDPRNNHPDNLEVFQTNAEHLRHELTGRVPNWTPEGRARTLEGARQKNRRPASKELCDLRRIQATLRTRDKSGRFVPGASKPRE